MTYQELTIFGRLRKLNKLGPFGMFQRLVHDWSMDRERTPGDDAPYYTPAQVAEKVKKFFHYYAINRRCPWSTAMARDVERLGCLLTSAQGTR